MNASSPRPTLPRSTVAVKPVMIPARSRRRTRSAAPCGLRPTSAPRLANGVLPFRTSALMIRKSMSSSAADCTVRPLVGCAELTLARILRGRIPSRPQERAMRVGVLAEIKTDEYRVALTPAGARELSDAGHEVVVQTGAGAGSGISDEDYAAQGAAILPDADAVFTQADLIVKVKEPQPVEVARLQPRHTLFTYLHLAPDPELTQGLMASGATCIAYETVTDTGGRLPLLAPMSEVAGKIATQAGAFMLERPLGGRGLLLGGVAGVAAGKVLVIGGGVSGTQAAHVAIGIGAEVYVADRNIDRHERGRPRWSGLAPGWSCAGRLDARAPTAGLGRRRPAAVRRPA